MADSRPPYLPGSICSLQPRLSEDEVELFLEINGLQDRADEVVYIESADQGQGKFIFLFRQEMTCPQI
jgi:hypothetical protein